MSQNYLLTYLDKDTKTHSYEWFDEEDELLKYVVQNKIDYIDAVEIRVVREIELGQRW